MTDHIYIKTKCSREFKKKVEELAKIRNQNIASLVISLLEQEIGWDPAKITKGGQA